MKTRGKMKKEIQFSEEQLMVAAKKITDNHAIYKTPHFQEQVYLMGKWGFDTALITKFMKQELALQDVDFFRMLFLITKDFDYIKSNFLEKEFAYDDAIEKVMEYLLEKKYPTSEVEELKGEKDKLKAEFELHKAFLEKEFEFTRQMADQQHMHEKEIIALEGNSAIEVLKTENIHLKKQLEELKDSKEVIVKKKWFNLKKFFSHRPKLISEDETKEGFIVSLLHNLEFKPEQYAVILAAVENGLPLEDIKQIAKVALPADNMQLLCRMFYKKRKITPAAVIAAQSKDITEEEKEVLETSSETQKDTDEKQVEDKVNE